MTEIVVDANPAAALRAVGAGVGLMVFGLVLTGPWPGSGSTPGGVALGVGFMGLGLASLFAGRRIRRRVRGIAVSAQGLRSVGWERDWVVMWSEVAAVVVPPDRVFDLRTKMLARGTLENARIVVDLVPADAGFGARHPELAGSRTAEGAYRINVGHAPSVARRLNLALSTFGQGRFSGMPGPRVAAGRPWQLVAGLVVCTVAWVGAMVQMVAGVPADLSGLPAAVLVGVGVPIWIYRAWHGGPRAVPAFAVLATVIGGGMLVLTASLMDWGDPVGPRVGVSMVVAGLLLGGGLALRTRAVRDWIRARQYGTA
ncbi:hypothetical protein [Nonomuraea sp. NPDC050310]|uniref:hypothetical protein n=1 Tax=unclassified Nonomuraea TaxID=2593643 RepID=UPI0033F30407